MVFRYYNIPNVNPAGILQCGVVGVMVGNPCAADCRCCSNLPAGRPIIAGISPAGSSAFGPLHAVQIVGYDGDDDSMVLTINDPYPYGFSSPYEAAGGGGGSGQYTIRYTRFKSRLRWSQSVYGIDEP
jgi:hypothetical protein